MIKKHFTLAAAILICGAAQAQYDNNKAFAPNFYTSNGNTFRAANGQPGENYWQNKADYTVKANFDTATMLLTGKVSINYINNSPNALKYVWLELDQNMDREDATAQIMTQPKLKVGAQKGFALHSVKVFIDGKWQNADYIVHDTRMQIRLPKALQGKGAIQKIAIDYQYTLLKSGGGDRSGYMDTKNGRIYEFSYWYPRMSVYDDLIGWNTQPFVGGGEMYMDYGDIDYTLTVPSGYLLVGSGDILNPKEVFSAQTLSRIAKAKNSDQTVTIRDIHELGSSATLKNSGTTTWHLKMENTRDVAWAFSKSYIWDAAKINLPAGKTALAQSVYPVESIKGDTGWTNATKYLKASVEIFSQKWFPFPYPVATNVGGPIGGMEFPALAFDHYSASGKDLWMLVSHEIGHTWYPMIVGSNERKNGWMDEGFNTFVDIYAQAQYDNGKFAPKRDGEYAPKGGNPADEIIPYIAERPNGPFPITAPDASDYKDVHPLEYFKTAFGLVLLREVILDSNRFDYAFQNYTHDWAYKHPSPNDFFRYMDNAAGADLTWFWRGWFYNNWQLDQAITKVEYPQNHANAGAIVTIENKQQMPMPVLLLVKEKNGNEYHLKLPVEIWQRGNTWKCTLPTHTEIESITIDPQHLLPDIDRSNNIWRS